MSQATCNCHEERDDETGEVYESYCNECAYKNGECECKCGCGQCLYSEIPCANSVAYPKEPCHFCMRRLIDDTYTAVEAKRSWCYEILIDKRHAEYDTAKYLLKSRVDPCLHTASIAFPQMKNDPYWTYSVFAEMKKILYTSGAPPCGIWECTCHLREVNQLLLKRCDQERAALHTRIIAAEEAMHAAHVAAEVAQRAQEAAAQHYLTCLGAKYGSEATYQKLMEEKATQSVFA